MSFSRSYTELSQLRTFEERYQYLRLTGAVGDVTFGSDRWLNQAFYTSTQWRQVREFVIARDESCELGWLEFPVYSRVMVHHMNPMTEEQLIHGDPDVLNPEYLISCSHRTHNAIHYGDESQLPRVLTERRPGDTTLW